MALIAMDRWLQVNHALCRITGHTEAALKATTLRAMTHPDDIDLDAQSWSSSDRQDPQLPGRANAVTPGAIMSASADDASVVLGEDRDPYIRTQVRHRRKDLARRLEYFVDHDFLTGLFNRHFEQGSRRNDRVISLWRPGRSWSSISTTSKDVNDTFGHKAGDDVLKGVAGLLGGIPSDGHRGADRRGRVRRAAPADRADHAQVWPTSWSRPWASRRLCSPIARSI
jgi:hypothetical protein